MLPRPRLVCQEPGLRPIGRSPGVPDKSSRGLGSMSRYSAQILICLYNIHFPFYFIPLWVWLGILRDCLHAQRPMPSSIVIRMRLVIRQSKLAKVQPAHENTLWHLYHRTGETDRWNIWNLYQWKVFSTRTKWMGSFFNVFQPTILTDSSTCLN